MDNLYICKEKIVSKLSYIKNKIYRKELGVILSYDLSKFVKDNFNSCINEEDNNKINFKKSDDVEDIFEFFNRMKKARISYNVIEEWLKQDNDCWLIYDGNKVIGGTWVLKGKMKIPQLTEKWLSKDESVIFDKNVAYRGNTIIDSNYRGQGIYKSFNQHILNYYHNRGSINKMILITRASNASVISTTMNNNGKLIGIVEVRNILGWIHREEIFLNKKEKKWG